LFICKDLEKQHNLLINKSLYSLYNFVLACYYVIEKKYKDNKGNCKLTLLALPKSKSYYTLARHLVKVDEQKREKKETTAGGGCDSST
jgi:hypothetical protein